MIVKRKIREWLRRYLPGEIIGTVTAVTAASIAHFYSSNLIFVAYVGALGEAIGFYSTVFIQQVLVVKGSNRVNLKIFSFSDLTRIISDIFWEFGPAGLLDDLVLRPFFMYIFPGIVGNFTLGILIGKIVGDLSFYFLVICSYEIIKYKKKFSVKTIGTIKATRECN